MGIQFLLHVIISYLEAPLASINLFLSIFLTIGFLILTALSLLFFSLSTFSRALLLFWPGWPYELAVIVIYPINYATLKIGSP